VNNAHECADPRASALALQDGWIDVAGGLQKPWRQRLGDLLVFPKLMEGYSTARHFERPIDYYRDSVLATVQR